MAILAATRGAEWLTVADEYRERVPRCAWGGDALDRDEIALLDHRAAESVDHHIRRVRALAYEHVCASFGATRRDGVPQAIWRRVDHSMWDSLLVLVGDRL